jgi:hypothetical protein
LVGASLVKAAPTFKPQTFKGMSRLAGQLDNPLTRGRWSRAHGYIVPLGESTATFFSAEPTANVVGATADTLLECDEAQDVQPNKWDDKDFRPMAAVGNAINVYYGTPWREDDLLARAIAEAKAAEADDGIRRHFEISWEAVTAANPLHGRHVEGSALSVRPSRSSRSRARAGPARSIRSPSCRAPRVAPAPDSSIGATART